MIYVLIQIFSIVILLLMAANLTVSLLILVNIFSSLDKAKNMKERMFPFWTWMEKHGWK